MNKTNFVIEPHEVQALLEQENILIIDLGSAESYQQHHLKGAINLDYKHIVHGQLPAPGGLPDTFRLQALFDALGLNQDTHVLIYDDEGNGKASRFIWTLDVIGHHQYNLINGGIHSWVNEGFAYECDAVRPQPNRAELKMNSAPIADKTYIFNILHSNDHILLDTRTHDEYTGIKGGIRKGHIPGAINFNWLGAIDRDNNLKYFSKDILNEKLASLGLSKDKEIITYCYSFHRAAHTYVLLKYLGYPRVKGYAGSWAEWNADVSLPIE